jgi:hypothetical protein
VNARPGTVNAAVCGVDDCTHPPIYSFTVHRPRLWPLPRAYRRYAYCPNHQGVVTAAAYGWAGGLNR